MTARALLDFDWEKVLGATIFSIVGQERSTMSDGSLRWRSIAFVVHEAVVVLSVAEDTDEVVVTLERALPANGRPWSDIEQLSGAVKRELGWCWLGRNYRGYVDTFTVAIDGSDPTYTFVGEASYLLCMQAAPLRA